MINFSTSEKIGGTFASAYVTLKMTIFTDAVSHFGLVVYDAGLAGIAGLLVMHYGKKILPIFDNWVKGKINNWLK